MMQLIGVGANATLFSYDMLRLDGTDAAQPLVDGVADLRALYGVDSDNDGLIDDLGRADRCQLHRGRTDRRHARAAQQRVMSIMAVRVGLVLRSDRIEREDVAPAIDHAVHRPARRRAAHPRHRAGDLRHQRFRRVEFTVPLRNVMMAAR